MDLVIIDRRGEKTAVQAKCYAENNNVGVQTVRELVGAKRNHDCILALLVTTSDLTARAKKEAENFKVEFWHGVLVEQKLSNLKWKPGGHQSQSYHRSKIKKEWIATRSETAVTSETIKCVCGAMMVKRKNKEGKYFWAVPRFQHAEIQGQSKIDSRRSLIVIPSCSCSKSSCGSYVNCLPTYCQSGWNGL